MKDEKHFGLRVDGELLKKFRFVSDYEGRSANAQILILMRKFVNEYEKEHGKIEVEENKK